jgi:hypothetical protein
VYPGSGVGTGVWKGLPLSLFCIASGAMVQDSGIRIYSFILHALLLAQREAFSLTRQREDQFGGTGVMMAETQ